MIDIKLLKKDPDKIIKQLSLRGGNFEYLKEIIKLDDLRISIIQDVEVKKAFRNNKSKEIGKAKNSGECIESILTEVSKLKFQIESLDHKQKETEKKIKEILLKTPNVPRETVPNGNDEYANDEIRKWGEPKKFDFEVKDHADLATNLNIINFEQAAKITGARFAVYKGIGARLHRALTQYLLDKQTEENGFIEVLTPYIVNQNSMENTGQLPKFEEDLYKVNENMYLIPTSEVPITNIHKNEVLDLEKTIKYCSYSPCFRSEAGSAGRDVKGIIRQHQFHKVEMLMFSKPENSLQDLEKMTSFAEEILQDLELPYRVVELCTGDLGFSSSKTYDIEVWLPSQGTYREISSCSNMSDFQARRANIKYRNTDGSLSFVHTLNGSGLPIGRTLAAIIENYQQEDGSILVPEVLKSYLKTEIIK